MNFKPPHNNMIYVAFPPSGPPIVMTLRFWHCKNVMDLPLTISYMYLRREVRQPHTAKRLIQWHGIHGQIIRTAHQTKAYFAASQLNRTISFQRVYIILQLGIFQYLKNCRPHIKIFLLFNVVAHFLKLLFDIITLNNTSSMLFSCQSADLSLTVERQLTIWYFPMS